MTVTASAGLKTARWSYDHAAMIATLGHERAHENIAFEIFYPEGPFAILPLQGKRSSIVWTEERALGEAIVAADASSFLAELTRRFGEKRVANRLHGRDEFTETCRIDQFRFTGHRVDDALGRAASGQPHPRLPHPLRHRRHRAQ